MTQRQSLADRIKASVIITENGCWEWQKHLDRHGYGRLKFEMRDLLAHRASYTAFITPVANDVEVRHLCANKACVNPRHLHAVGRTWRWIEGWCKRQAPEKECLPWPFGRASGGYGRARNPRTGKAEQAHRLMCRMAHGEPPAEDTHALHKCGNGHLGCVNPNHLYWGTRLDNARDAVRHGTQPRGVKNGAAKLTEDDVRAIRSRLQDGVSQREVAIAYGVSQSTISIINNRRRWAHV